MREPGVEDATRRTRLANERTFLAWWRTGLTSFAVCIGIDRVVPATADVTHWPYEVVGAAFGVLGIALGYSLWRTARTDTTTSAAAVVSPLVTSAAVECAGADPAG